MNYTVEHQLEHRSIRKFKQNKLDDNVIQNLMKVVNRTATSQNLQLSSIIRITDDAKKEKFANICKMDYMGKSPELWFFIVDAYRNYKIMEEQGKIFKGAVSIDRFVQGYTDACLQAQNLTVAVESLGMGAVYYGVILAYLDEIIKELKLPKYTFPVIGVGFGEKDQEVALKPRLDEKIKFFENEYVEYSDYLELISDYDKIMQTYYDSRKYDKPEDSFSKQVFSRYEVASNRKNEFIEHVIKQGFLL